MKYECNKIYFKIINSRPMRTAAEWDRHDIYILYYIILIWEPNRIMNDYPPVS